MKPMAMRVRNLIVSCARNSREIDLPAATCGACGQMTTAVCMALNDDAAQMIHEMP